MSPRSNFYLSLAFTALNLYSFYVSGSIISLAFLLFCGWQTYRMRHYA